MYERRLLPHRGFQKLSSLRTLIRIRGVAYWVCRADLTVVGLQDRRVPRRGWMLKDDYPWCSDGKEEAHGLGFGARLADSVT